MTSHQRINRSSPIAAAIGFAMGALFPPAAVAAAPTPRPLIPLGPLQPPPPPPPPPPAPPGDPETPPAPPAPDPSRTPYPAPGYARWELPPAPPDTYLDDLPPETEGRHTGFSMRLALGPGYYSMWADAAEGSLALRAAGAGLSLSLGGALAEDLVLFGEIALQSTLDPEVDSYDNGRARAGTSVTTAAIGAGLGYHLRPAQVFFSGSLLVAQARAVDRPTERLLGKTDLGPGLALSVGKDWWMSPRWTIGVLGRVQAARLRDPAHGRSGAMWDSFGISLAFCVGLE